MKKINSKIKKEKKRTSLMMEYEEDLMTTQLDDFEDDADDATEM
jgi:hypothetical protein